MKRPKSVRVGWLREVKIHWLSNKKWRKHESLDDHEGGCFFGGSKEIYIRLVDDQHEDLNRETLWHEIIHAVYFETNIVNTQNVIRHKHMEEAVVGSLSGPLLAVLRDNPKILKYLLQVD